MIEAVFFEDPWLYFRAEASHLNKLTNGSSVEISAIRKQCFEYLVVKEHRHRLVFTHFAHHSIVLNHSLLNILLRLFRKFLIAWCMMTATIHTLLVFELYVSLTYFVHLFIRLYDCSFNQMFQLLIVFFEHSLVLEWGTSTSCHKGREEGIMTRLLSTRRLLTLEVANTSCFVCRVVSDWVCSVETTLHGVVLHSLVKHVPWVLGWLER